MRHENIKKLRGKEGNSSKKGQQIGSELMSKSSEAFVGKRGCNLNNTLAGVPKLIRKYPFQTLLVGFGIGFCVTCGLRQI